MKLSDIMKIGEEQPAKTATLSAIIHAAIHGVSLQTEVKSPPTFTRQKVLKFIKFYLYRSISEFCVNSLSPWGPNIRQINRHDKDMSRNWVLFAHRGNSQYLTFMSHHMACNMATKEVYHDLDVFAQ